MSFRSERYVIVSEHGAHTILPADWTEAQAEEYLDTVRACEENRLRSRYLQGKHYDTSRIHYRLERVPEIPTPIRA